MAEWLAEREAPRALRGTALATGIKALPATVRWVLRVEASALGRLSAVLGFEPPSTVCRAGTDHTRAALCLGPDEWLLLGPEGDAATLGGQISRALDGITHSLVDVSHRQVSFEVSGPSAEGLLANGCPLDLDRAAFPVGMCTRTVFAKAEIVLWRTDEQVFHVEVWRSFANYLIDVLQRVQREG